MTVRSIRLVIMLAACKSGAQGTTLEPARVDPGVDAAPAAYRHPTPLVVGNGFGLALYSTKLGGLSKLYAHPYSFTKPDPRDALGEGIPTTNFVEKLVWDEPGPSQVHYLEESHVIAADRPGSQQVFFMPFGLRRNVLIAMWQPRGGTAVAPPLCVDWAHRLRSRRLEHVAGVDVQVFRFDGVDETLVAVPLGPEVPAEVARTPCLTGRTAWALASLEEVEDLGPAVAEIRRWGDGQHPRALVERELKEIEAWRVVPTVAFASDEERRLWRQSEIVLRMAQSREANRPGRVNYGLIVACLADGTWVTPWVRDMAYAIDALVRMGHQAEARAALEAYFNAQPIGRMQREVGDVPYQISVVRYFGDGSEEPYFTQEGATNVEFDNWGLVLWALGGYVERFHDREILSTPTYRGTVYESARRFVVEPLLRNLEPFQGGLIVGMDTSIWEERQKDRKHFAFSTAAAIAGLRRFDRLALAQGDRALHAELAQVLPRLDRGFARAFLEGGRLRGTLEPGPKNDVDGAVLAAINLGVVSDREVMRRTVESMSRLAVASGGYRRVTCILDDPKIFEYFYERQEFVFVDLALAEVYLRLGRPEKAAPLVTTIVDKAARDHFFVPEMYVSVVNPLFRGDLGDPTGVIPTVGYGAGAYISYLIQRQALASAPAGAFGP